MIAIACDHIEPPARLLTIRRSRLRPDFLIVLGKYPPGFSARLSELIPASEREWDSLGKLWRVYEASKPALEWLVMSCNSRTVMA